MICLFRASDNALPRTMALGSQELPGSLGGALPATIPSLTCVLPLHACARCSTCSPFGCGQDALPNETVAQRGDHGSWPLKNAHNRTTAPKLRERPRSSREAP